MLKEPAPGARRGTAARPIGESAALGVAVAGPLGAYAEHYTLHPSGGVGPDANVLNGGLTLGLGPDLQLDARAGGRLGSGGPDFFFGAGVASRN